MENDRKFTEMTHRTVQAHKLMIEKMRGDNELLKTELALEIRSSKLAQGLVSSDEIQRLQDEGDRYTRKVEQEKRAIAELEASITAATMRLEGARSKKGGADSASNIAQKFKKDIRRMENGLDKALVRYNETLANNKGLRSSIDNARKERVVFDGIYKKLERQLHEKKKDMAGIIERSHEAYESRDKAQMDMQALKQRAEKEQAEFEAEWAELGKLIEQDRAMKDDMDRQETKNAGGDGGSKIGNLSLKEEANLKRKVVRGAWTIAKDKAQLHLTTEKVQSYEEAFLKIQKQTGISDIDELVTKFIEAEDKNFSLFNFVNELNSEIERLEMLISNLKSEIEKFKGQGMNTDNQRKKILHDLDNRLSRTHEKADYYDDQFQVASKTINQLKTGIHSIFTRIGCATTSVEEMLGNQGVTESNMMQYLGIIEQRTTEILQTHTLNQNQVGLSSTGGGRSKPNTQVSVQPPGWDDLSEDDDNDGEDDERPLTREELQEKTKKTLTKREGGKKKKGGH